jgi:hypothetical protein
MLYREVIAVCSEIHTKHINTPCVKKVELLILNRPVHIVTTMLDCLIIQSLTRYVFP